MIGECETHPSITGVELAAEAPDTMPSQTSRTGSVNRGGCTWLSWINDGR